MFFVVEVVAGSLAVANAIGICAIAAIWAAPLVEIATSAISE